MKFKCLASGNFVEFFEAHDIKAMLEHHQYEPVGEVPDDLPETSLNFRAPLVTSKKKTKG